MNCISLIQPWASAIELNLKTIETRSWPAPDSAIGKPLAIAASKGKKSRDVFESLMTIPDIRATFYARGYYRFGDLPFGQVVAMTVLDGCFSTNGDPPRSFAASRHEFRLGDFSINRWAWTLSEITRIAPLPVVGRLGIFQWDGGIA